MDLISEPAFTEEHVTDFDIVYKGGLTDMLTLRPNDTVVETETRIIITIAQPPEVIKVIVANVLSSRERPRIIRRPIKLAPRPDSTDANLSLGR